MTIREHLKRRVRLALAIAAGAWLYVMVSMSYMRPAHNNKVPVSFFIAPVVMVLAMRAISWIKCPHCSKRFGSAAWGVGIPLWSRTDFCPRCGVNLDQPMPTKLIS